MKIQTGLSEGQVLQRLDGRGASVRLQGTCGEAGPVLATISGQRGLLKKWKKRPVGACARKQFSVVLADIPAGGPYRLKLQVGEKKAVVKSFFVGDVWLLAGQSNMQGIGDMTGRAKPHPLIRSFSMRREWILAADPLHVMGESPDICHHGGNPLSEEAAREFRRETKKGVGVGIFFAREMLKRSGVPQGLICTAHGGTSMAQWDPKEKGKAGASFYGSMLLSVKATGQPVAGVLWYQGESDAFPEAAPHYTARMKKLAAATRRDLRSPHLPWIVVQLARVFGGWNPIPWNDIQEQQRLLPDKIKNLEVVAAIDLSLDDSIHISAAAYPRLGARLARMADRLIYGNKKEKSSPRLRKVRINPPQSPAIDWSLDFIFDGVEGGLRAAGEPHGFALVLGNRQSSMNYYKTTLHGNRVRVHLTHNGGEVVAHYGCGAMPICNITDGRDLSLPVLGPLVISKSAYLPYIMNWKVTDVISSSVPLEKLECPDVEAFGGVAKTYEGGGFLNEYARWQGKSGHAYFSTEIDLPEAMDLEFRLGYDGPFRMWIDRQPFYDDLKGTNPAVVDAYRKTTRLAAGKHRLTAAIDINGGRATGIVLRLVRHDVSIAELRDFSYLRPVYLG
jgi:hypothetical protein